MSSSCPCPNKDRACKKLEFLDGSSTSYQQIIPDRDVSGASFPRGVIQFPVSVGNAQYWNPSRSYMEFVVTVDDWAGGAVDPDFTWAKNTGACFFESMSFLFKGREVFSISNDLAIVDTVYKRLTYRRGPHDYTAEDVDNALMFDKGENVSGGDGTRLVTKFCWKLPVIEDMGMIPPGNYVIQLNPSPNYATRVVKLPLDTDSNDISFTTAGSSHSARVQLDSLKYWAHTTTLACGAGPVPKDVRVPTTKGGVYDLQAKAGSLRITAEQLARNIVFGFTDARRNIDARIETTDLKFYLDEATVGTDDIIPAAEQSHYLNTFQADVRGVSKPNPQFQLYDPLSDTLERDLYMYSRGNRRWPLTMEAFNKYEDDGSYILMDFPLKENSSDQGAVRYGFDAAVDISNGQLVVFEILDTRFLFDVDADACVLIKREC